MPLSRRDREFRLPGISYLDFKHLEMDRVLTALFARLAHSGFPSRLSRNFELTLETFVREFLDHPEWFAGFAAHREIVERWVETHLMDVVSRGTAKQAIASPRPLHGYSYRFRNPKHSRDYGASQHVYEMLYGARDGAGQKAIEHIKAFFFAGVDPITGQATGENVDVETQAILRLPHDQVSDAPDNRPGAREIFPPLCVGTSDLLADDVQRLLFYQRFIPRSVMVDYLEVLIAFHLALYHLRILKLLPALVRRQAAEPTCARNACPFNARDGVNPHGDCPQRSGILVDVVGQPRGAVARLAEQSADAHYRRIPTFVRAYFATRKLHEFAGDLVRRGRLGRPAGDFTVGDVLALLAPSHKAEREKFFGQRVYGLIQDSSGGTDGELDPDLRAVTEMGLAEFETYIEMIVALRGAFHRQYITECLDSLHLKNRPGALLAQGRTKSSPRRFILDSRLLEVLLQIAVLRPGGVLGYYTGELRIDELIAFLRERYGIHVDCLPKGDGFANPSIDDRRALRQNRNAFVERLRDIGFYRDLSDAYLTQTVTPRYRIGKSEKAAPAQGERT